MTWFELRTSGVGNDRSTNWATFTANALELVATINHKVSFPKWFGLPNDILLKDVCHKMSHPPRKSNFEKLYKRFFFHSFFKNESRSKFCSKKGAKVFGWKFFLRKLESDSENWNWFHKKLFFHQTLWSFSWKV